MLSVCSGAISCQAGGGIASSVWRPARKDMPARREGDCFGGLAACSQRHALMSLRARVRFFLHPPKQSPARKETASAAWRPARKDMPARREGDCFVGLAACSQRHACQAGGGLLRQPGGLLEKTCLQQIMANYINVSLAVSMTFSGEGNILQ